MNTSFSLFCSCCHCSYCCWIINDFSYAIFVLCISLTSSVKHLAVGLRYLPVQCSFQLHNIHLKTFPFCRDRLCLIIIDVFMCCFFINLLSLLENTSSRLYQYHKKNEKVLWILQKYIYRLISMC